jgi:CheY-like chemotaxis protein
VSEAPANLPCRILVVDDEPAFREMLALMLERAGYQTATAADGAAGAQCLEQSRFDLVITDMLMPDCDGLEFIADLRQRFPRTRIVAMSGGGHIAGEKYLKMARGLGAHSTLAKPFTQDELLTAVAAMLVVGAKPPLA